MTCSIFYKGYAMTCSMRLNVTSNRTSFSSLPFPPIFPEPEFELSNRSNRFSPPPTSRFGSLGRVHLGTDKSCGQMIVLELGNVTYRDRSKGRTISKPSRHIEPAPYKDRVHSTEPSLTYCGLLY